jgi:hypothetical protein
MKRCSLCKEWKDKSCFVKHVTRKDGLHNRCKNCCRIKKREIARNARDILRKMKAERGCKYCGQNDVLFLDYHHIDPKQKIKSVTRLTTLRAMLREASKCDVVCSHCHRRINEGQYLLPKELATPGAKLPVILV